MLMFDSEVEKDKKRRAKMQRSDTQKDLEERGKAHTSNPDVNVIEDTIRYKDDHCAIITGHFYSAFESMPHYVAFIDLIKEGYTCIGIDSRDHMFFQKLPK